MIELVQPAPDYLPGFIDALRRGWSPDNLRNEARAEILAELAKDTPAYIRAQDDREAKGNPITLPDGSLVPRLPGFVRWLWDGEFCGTIGIRWQPGTADLPPTCLGHIGYAVVPWKRGRGYAKAALAALLPQVRQLGLPYVDVTTDPENLASQAVIAANGGALVEKFQKPANYGNKIGYRYRITL